MGKVLVFGNLPLRAGGRQTSGASSVMWQLAEQINQREGVSKVEFVATDIFKEVQKIGNTMVYGWNKWSAIRNVFKVPLRAVDYLKDARELAADYEYSLVSVFIKLTWFDTVVRSNKKAIYHLHGTDYFAIMQKVFLRNNISFSRLVYTVHAIGGNDTNIAQQKQEQQKEKTLTNSQPYLIAFVSGALQLEWSSTYGSVNSTVITNAVDDVYIQYRNKGSIAQRDYNSGIKIVVSVGSISERKGQLRALQALSRSGNKETIIYKCIGHAEASELKQLMDFARQHHVQFEYLGVLNAEEILGELATAHFMLLASSSEGFGLVYLESICAGTPVVLPKALPIVSEAGLTVENAVFLEDHSSDAIAAFFDNIEVYSFDNNQVARSLNPASWGDVATEYEKVYKKMYESIR